MNAAFFAELNDARLRYGAGDAKFRHVGGIRMWMGSAVAAGSLFAFGKAALVFGLLEGGLFLMGLTWLLAEIISRAFRLALLSGVLLAGFTAGSFFVGSDLAQQFVGSMITDPVMLRPNLDSSRALTVGASLLLTSLALATYYMRFRVPLTVATAVAFLFVSLSGICAALAGSIDERWDRVITLVFSATSLVLAFRFDLTDLQRSTRRSDVAFWLYLLAGLSAIFSVFDDFARLNAYPDPTSQIVAVLALLTLGVIGLVVDRRVLISAPVLYIGTVMAYIDWQFHGTGVGISFWLLGTALLMLGLMWYWTAIRAKLLVLLPLGRMALILRPSNGAPK